MTHVWTVQRYFDAGGADSGRTWPTQEEFAAMLDEKFNAYLVSVGLLSSDDDLTAYDYSDDPVPPDTEEGVAEPVEPEPDEDDLHMERLDHS